MKTSTQKKDYSENTGFLQGNVIRTVAPKRNGPSGVMVVSDGNIYKVKMWESRKHIAEALKKGIERGQLVSFAGYPDEKASNEDVTVLNGTYFRIEAQSRRKAQAPTAEGALPQGFEPRLPKQGSKTSHSEGSPSHSPSARGAHPQGSESLPAPKVRKVKAAPGEIGGDYELISAPDFEMQTAPAKRTAGKAAAKKATAKKTSKAKATAESPYGDLTGRIAYICKGVGNGPAKAKIEATDGKSYCVKLWASKDSIAKALDEGLRRNDFVAFNGKVDEGCPVWKDGTVTLHGSYMKILKRN